jgi:osmotically-inducible protein OsmY
VVNHIEVGRYEDRQAENRGDTGLARAVQNELAKNRNVNNDRIWVTAHEGTVVLEGTVEDRSEMGAAVEDAYEAGARRVDNRLRVAN